MESVGDRGKVVKRGRSEIDGEGETNLPHFFVMD